MLCRGLRARAQTPLVDHWCFRLRSLAYFHFAQPDPLLSSWMSSSPAYTLQDFPVLADLASEHTAGPSLTQTPGNSNGGSAPANHAPIAASKYSNTDRPCCVQVAITVQIRSHQRFPLWRFTGVIGGAVLRLVRNLVAWRRSLDIPGWFSMRSIERQTFEQSNDWFPAFEETHSDRFG